MVFLEPLGSDTLWRFAWLCGGRSRGGAAAAIRARYYGRAYKRRRRRALAGFMARAFDSSVERCMCTRLYTALKTFSGYFFLVESRCIMEIIGVAQDVTFSPYLG